MYTRKEKAENSYYPSFLRLDVDTPDDISLIGKSALDPRTEAAFLHEYIHYLQDITTLSGYMRIGTIVDQVKWVVNNSKSKIRIPFDAKSTYRYNLCSNAISMELSSGSFSIRDSKGEKVKADIVSIDSFYLVPKIIPVPTRSQKYFVQETILEFTDQLNQKRRYSVGEYAISESMAYMIEQCIYPDVLPQPDDCPYYVVEKIVNSECPRASNPLVMIAMCDVALNFPFPGYAFYEIVQQLKTASQISADYIYSLWYSGRLDYVVKKQIDWANNIDDACLIATKQIEDYFLHKYWQDTKESVHQTFFMGRELRKSNPKFFSDIALGGDICSNQNFLRILSQCGCLCACTPNGLYTIAPNNICTNIRPESFVCLSEIYKILLTNDAVQNTPAGKCLAYKCSLKDWCSHSFLNDGVDDITSSSLNCIEAPWDNNIPENRPQCEFARMWYAFKLGKPRVRN